MTDDKEERILRLRKEKHLTLSMEGPVYIPKWESLELAPKHTDEEYDEVLARLNNCHLEWARLNKLALHYEARIKELEVQLKVSK